MLGHSMLICFCQEHPDDKDIDIGEVVGSKTWMGMQQGAAYEMVLKYLYGMPIFTDGEEIQPDLLLMLHDLAKVFEMPSLSEHTIVLFERSLEACIVDLKTGLVKDKPQVEKFIQHIETLNKEDFKLLEKVVIKAFCKHYSLICKHKYYPYLLGKHPQLPNLMLEYISRERDGLLL